jgi:hypothetical protein
MAVKCPRGYTFRKSYIRKNTGTRVRGSCIRSTSPYSTSMKAKQQRLSGHSRGTRKRCPPGQIARASYVRRVSSNIANRGYLKRTPSGRAIRVYPKEKSVYVKAACVKDMGKPGKLAEGAQKIGPLRKGELSKHGYDYKLPEIQRHAALQKAISEYGPLSTYRKLDAASKLTAQTSPQSSQAFATDRNWIRKMYANSSGIIRAF